MKERSIAQWWFLQSANPFVGWSLWLLAKGNRWAASTRLNGGLPIRTWRPQAVHL